jgi:hypothetical protein
MDTNIQEPFASDLFAPLPTSAETSWRAERLAFYRNHVMPIDILAARFPVLRRLVGADSFAAMARRFVMSEPPTPLSLPRYGETFPRFLRRHACNAVAIEYIADVAELEMVRGKALEAAKAVPIDPRTASSMRAERFDEWRFALHPSLFLVASRFPVVTIWEHNRSRGKKRMIERWRAESALVARPFNRVEVRRIPPGGYPFIRALSQGETVSAAIDAAVAAAPHFDIAVNLAFLIEANVVIGIRQRARGIT